MVHLNEKGNRLLHLLIYVKTRLCRRLIESTICPTGQLPRQCSRQRRKGSLVMGVTYPGTLSMIASR